VGIIGVVLTSQGTPQKIPALDAVISNVDRTVFVYHDGGDPLTRSEMYILVNGEREDFLKNGDPGWTTWSTGESLAYSVPGSDPITKVQVVYTSGSAATVLSSADFGASGMPTTVPTGTPGPTHTITATASAGGAITPSGAVVVSEGSDQAFAMTPDAGYYIVDVLVDGVSQGVITSYTFNNVLTDHTIAVTFSSSPHTITATATAGGTITPSGAVSVTHGASQSFSIAPDFGFHITDVVVNGTSQGAITSYTFTNVETDHTIAASFAADTYTISSSAGANGAISPLGAMTVTHGSSQSYAITPDAGYHVADVLIDGVSNGTLTSYTFTNVQADHTIAASFAINTYTITASAGANGAIAPSGTVTVNHGANQAFTITNSTGYHLQTLTIDGTPTTYPPVIPPLYTFSNVQDNHTISAAFSQNARADIFYDGFETTRPSGNGWTETGSVDWGAYTPRNGNYDVRLRQTEAITRTIPTTTSSSVIVQFAWAAQSLEAGEYVRAEYSTDGGGTWTTLSQINGVVGASTPAFTNYVSGILPAAADHNANFRLRFRIQSSATNDYAYIDDVRVTGIPDRI
jgi:hypothetical protein